jgi:hypothetical protein
MNMSICILKSPAKTALLTKTSLFDCLQPLHSVPAFTLRINILAYSLHLTAHSIATRPLCGNNSSAITHHESPN